MKTHGKRESSLFKSQYGRPSSRHRHDKNIFEPIKAAGENGIIPINSKKLHNRLKQRVELDFVCLCLGVLYCG